MGTFHGGLTQEQINRFRTYPAKRPVISNFTEALKDEMASTGAMLEMACTTYDWGMWIGAVVGQGESGYADGGCSV